MVHSFSNDLLALEGVFPLFSATVAPATKAVMGAEATDIPTSVTIFSSSKRYVTFSPQVTF